MKLTASTTESGYPGFFVTVDGIEYELEYPLTSEKIIHFRKITWKYSINSKKKQAKTGMPDITDSFVDNCLNFMLKIPNKILKRMDIRDKVRFYKALSDYTLKSDIEEKPDPGNQITEEEIELRLQAETKKKEI